MGDSDLLVAAFEEQRDHLRAVAYRLLGSTADAEDAVQDTWLRLTGADTSEVENLGGWLTTVVARVSLNMLRARQHRHEEPVGASWPTAAEAAARTTGTAATGGGTGSPGRTEDPEEEAVLADSVGLALLVVLDTLAPAERLAFVLHDMFAMPFEEIAPIVDRSPAAARQLASRGRRRVQQADFEPETPEASRQREVVAAFLAASREGDFEALLAMLDPDIVLRVDNAAALMGATGATGAAAVAGTFSGHPMATRPALSDGAAGLIWAQGGVTRVVFSFTITGGTVSAMELIADPGRISELEVIPRLNSHW
jgi:RNA polymerase sigma factor (sigma-70 family)